MPRLLDGLAPGTPVLANDGASVGSIRALYGSGESRVVEFLLVHWDKRGEEALVGADEVANLSDEGVILSKGAQSYEDLPAYDPKSNPMLHRL